MAKAIAVCALCIASAAVGAGNLTTILRSRLSKVFLTLQQAVTPKAAVASPAEMNVEVLGDRVRCDIRYQELKIPPSEYQSFKRKCMGDKWDGD